MVRVGFSTKRVWNPFSAAVRKILGTRISHSWLLVDDPALGTPVVLEARWPGGYHVVPYARFRTYERVIAVVRCPHALDRGVHATVHRLGDAFDLLGIVGIGLVRLVRRVLGIHCRNRFAAARGLFCSRAVLEAMQAAGYPGAAALDPTLTSPADLLAFLERDPESAVRGRRLRARLLPEVLRRVRRLRARRGSSAGGDRVAALPVPVARCAGAEPAAIELGSGGWDGCDPRMAAGE